MRKQIFTMIQLCLLVLTLVGLQTNSHAQTPFTITWTGLGGAGTTNATGVPTGINVTQQYNGVTATCVTSPSNGATTNYSAIIQAAAGYNVTITSIGGSAYGSGSGSKLFTLRLTNGSVYTQTNPTTIGTSSSCAGNSALNAFAIPAAGQTLNSGSQATVTVLRGIAALESGAGYSYTRSLTITGVVTPVCNAPLNLAENNVTATSSDFNWDAGGTNEYEYILDQTSTNPAGAGTTLTTNSFSTSSLSPSTTYYFHLRRKCGTSNFSNWILVNFTTPAAPCAAPTGLTAANTTHNSSDLSWDAQGSNTFEYVVDQTATAPATAGTATSGTTFNATTLNPMTTYYLHVRTDCGSGNVSPWTTISFTTLVTPCAAPTGLTAANTTHNSSDLSWDVQGSNTFEYVVNQTATAPATAGTATAGTTFNATTLNPLTTYYLHVRTDCGSGNLSPWTTISFTTLVTPCAAPTGLTAANTTHNSSDLSWNVQGSNTFEYVVDQTATAPATAGTATAGTTFNATTLNPMTTYYLHVRTDCGSGNLSPWTTISFTTLVTPCAAPTGLTAANTTHNSSDLSWDVQGSNTFEYVVDQLAADPIGLGTPTTGTTFNATTLNPLTTYYLHVRTDCSGTNFSPWVTISFTTLVTPCAAPTGLTAANTTDNSSDLSWNTQGSSTFEYVVDQTATAPATAGTATSGTTFNATLLSPLTTYYLHVRTDCGSGNLSPWTTISFTTLVTPCAVPTGLTAANTTDNSSDLSWNIQGGNSFEYLVDQTATAPAAAGTPTTATSYHASALSPSTTYYLHVRTDCGSGNFSNWTTILFTTLATPCTAPSGLSAANIAGHSADLIWNTQTGSTFEYVLNQTAANPTGSGTATPNNAFAATALNGSTTYYFHVRTNCGNGNFSTWTTISFTTASTVGLEEQEAINFNVYPNPTNGLVTISGQTQGNITLKNMNGQELMTIDLEQASSFDISNLESGLYFVVYTNGNKSSLIKLIKQ